MNSKLLSPHGLGGPFEVTFIIGPVGCSKSTTGRLLQFLVGDPTELMAIDSSTCIKNSITRRTKAGGILQTKESDQAAGFVLDGEPIAECVMENLRWIREEHGTRHSVVCGSPRSCEERDILLRLQRERKLVFKVVFINCSEKQMEQGILNRIEKGEIRLDQGPRETRKRKEECEYKTLPAVRGLPQHLVAYTHRSKPLRKRLMTALMHMDIPSHMRSIYMNRLHDKKHPIHEEIRKIEVRKDGKNEPVASSSHTTAALIPLSVAA